MYYLGVDAGGTKTKAIVVDEDGNTLGSGRGGAANYHNVGLEKAVTSVFVAVEKSLRESGLVASSLTASCVGIASFDTPLDKATLLRALKKEKDRLFGKNLTVVNDAVIGLYAGTSPPGVSLVSGTGSNCYGIGPDGREAFAGNWSYLLGDQGGGYHLSLRIFRAIMRAFDGRGEKTMLRDLVLSHLGIKDEFALVDWIYRERPTPGKIASFGQLLDEALKGKDRVAESIFDEHIAQLCVNVEAVVHRVALEKVAFDLVLIGSFFKTRGAIESMERKVHECSPKARLVFPKVAAVMGATLLAKKSGHK